MDGHTAGPWAVDATKALGAYGVWTDYSTHPGHDGEGYPSQICSVLPTEKSEITREQRDANARLIAASPDLLAACKEAILQIEHLHWKFAATGTGEAVLARIRAAVEKATGEKGGV